MMNSLPELLEKRAKDLAEFPAYVFLKSDETELTRISYGELRNMARSYASFFQGKIPKGEHVMILMPDEHLFLPVLWACFYANLVAIPAPALDIRSTLRMIPRLRSILYNAESHFVLTTKEVRDAILDTLEKKNFDGIQWVLVDEIDRSIGTDLVLDKSSAESIALLQYTSGSTSTPKGILLTHGNVLSNCVALESILSAYDPGCLGKVCVSWVPYYHDMGLIANRIACIYAGLTVVVMKPIDFLQRPVFWLRMISKYQAILITAPNFAFEICTKKISEAEVLRLDLSSLKLVANGGETVRLETMKKFASKFGKSGFNYQSFTPIYGLAESTLFVTGGRPGQLHIKSVSLESLQGKVPKDVPEGSPQSVQLVSAGPCLDQILRIVDPEKNTEMASGEIGEIWVSGKSVAKGYWKLPLETEKTFGAKIMGQYDLAFLRTGDLGFLADGELYFTGRLKDLIIINGSNHYPQDIELTAEKAHPSLRSGCSIAFSVDDGKKDEVVLVLEVKLPPGSKELRLVREAVLKSVGINHGIPIRDIALIPAGTIFKTSSGKVQRQLTKKMWANKGLIRLDSNLVSRFVSKLKLMRYLKTNLN